MKVVGWVVGAVVVVILALLVIGGVALVSLRGFRFYRPGMMGGYGMMGGFGFMGIGMLLTVLFWVLVIAGIVWLVATLARGGTTRVLAPQSGTSAQSPLDILKMRYAKGEITKEQYEEMKRDLGVV